MLHVMFPDPFSINCSNPVELFFFFSVKLEKNIKKQVMSLQKSYSMHVLAQWISLDFVFCYLGNYSH